MATAPVYIGTWRNTVTQIQAGHSTRPVRAWNAGTSGSRIHAINVGTSDAADNQINWLIGEELTLQSNMGTGTFVDGGGGDDTFTRGSGSFVTDGWKVGDRAVWYGSTTLANDFSAILTTVAALTLTFATATVATGEVLPSGGIIYRAARAWSIDVTLGAGAAEVLSEDGMNVTQGAFMDASPNRYFTLADNFALFAAVTTLCGTGESVDVVCFGGDY